MPKYELYNKKMHLTFIPLRSIKAGDFAVKCSYTLKKIHGQKNLRRN